MAIKSSRPLLLIAGAIVLIAGIVIAVAFVHLHRENKAADQEAPTSTHVATPGVLHFSSDAPQLGFIKTEKVEALPQPVLDPLNAILAYDDNHTARIYTAVEGRVIQLRAEIGEHVKQGQTLALIDAPEYAQAVADDAKANADLAQKKKAYDRAEELYKGEVLARKDLESAQDDLDQAQAEQIRAQARLRNLDPALRTDDNAGYALLAPIAGIVAERNISPGTEVRPDAANPLYVVTDPSHVWAIVDLPEQNLNVMHVGQKVTVDVDAYPDQHFPARVTTISATLDPTTRRVQVRCEVPNPDGLLKPQMYARVTPLADTHELHPRVPNVALITEGLYQYVFVEKTPGTYEKRKVTLAQQGSSDSYVRDGLLPGELVVTAGAALLNSELVGQ